MTERRRHHHSEVQPVDVDGVGTVTAGTLLWAVGLLATLVFRSDLDAAGRGWWLWTCAAGTALGLLGVAYCRRRRTAIRRDRRRAAKEAAAATAREPLT